MTTTPQLSTPEADAQSMVAPGQEALLEEFIQEQEAAAQAEEQQRILGKFNSTEDLAKAYQELEKKLGRNATSDPAESTPEPAQGYTADQAMEVYGKEAVEALNSKGLDLAGLMWKADNGEDISNHYDDLAATFNVPRQVVENYVSKAQAQAQPTPAAASGDGLSEADISELKGMVGGEEAFGRLNQWAAANMSQQELADYNAAVDSGNKTAVRWALSAMAARAAGGQQMAEPKLIGGGKPPAADRFESRQQVLDAMNKTNDRGQRLYDVDDAYRSKFMAVLANSEVF
jgi:hypothetical protein